MNKDQHVDRYQELAEKWLNGTISQDEKKEYAEWFETFSENDTINIDPETALSRAAHEKKLLKLINKQRIPARRSYKKLYYSLSAAAAIILLIGTTLYFFNSGQKKVVEEVVTNEPVLNDIKAGVNGSILTLANGKVIVIDTAQNGEIYEDAAGMLSKNGSQLEISASNNADESAFNTLTTPRGRTQFLKLSDGTAVWLNAGSSISFPLSFKGPERKVIITGEAYFEVEKDPSKPFMVKTGTTSIQVLGTHFNVMAYSNEDHLAATLLEGSVKVINNNRTRILKPGQQSRINVSGDLSMLDDVDTEQVVAWKNGMQSFSKADIGLIMRQVERWYDVTVEFQGPIPARTFSGEIPRSANLSQLLNLMETVARVHCRLDAKSRKLYVMPE